jgi:hypothetical protein
MNRHIIPSMLLSVLIVCSFAVLLFERDPGAAGKTPDRAASAKKASEAGTPTSAATAKDQASRTAKSAGSGEPVPRQALAQATEPTSRGPDSNEARPTADPATAPVASSPAQGKATNYGSDDPAGVRQSTESSAGPVALSSNSRAQVSTGPRSAFTVAQAGEGLTDVALRVYGSADRLDLLWRSNRDVLPRSDSPLSPGAVLRTPEE